VSERNLPAPPRVTGEGRQPGDPSPRQIVERVVRVDHAGEVGAVRIYEGQLWALKRRGLDRTPAAAKIRHMAEQ
jgi:ubiquinone biosynthesis monooxygenase Coq7